MLILKDHSIFLASTEISLTTLFLIICFPFMESETSDYSEIIYTGSLFAK